MNINEGEIITLDDGKEFICLKSTVENGVRYLFLMSNFKPVEVRFAEEIINGDQVQIKIVNDQNLKIHLMDLFK